MLIARIIIHQEEGPFCSTRIVLQISTLLCLEYAQKDLGISKKSNFEDILSEKSWNFGEFQFCSSIQLWDWITHKKAQEISLNFAWNHLEKSPFSVFFQSKNAKFNWLFIVFFTFFFPSLWIYSIFFHWNFFLVKNDEMNFNSIILFKQNIPWLFLDFFLEVESICLMLFYQFPFSSFFLSLVSEHDDKHNY